MSSTKRPPPKGPDRPMLRSSHGGRPKKAAAPPAARREGEAAAAPPAPRAAARAPREAARRNDGATMKKTRAAVPAGVSTASDEAREIAILVAVAGIEKKASGLEVIDVAGKVDYADFLVLMSGRSDRHVTALAGAIEEALRKRNKRALAVEGLPHASWVLMDFGDVVVHVFQEDARTMYDLEGLWVDAGRLPVPHAEVP